MKKLVIGLMMAFAATAAAVTTIDGFKYDLNTGNKTASLTGYEGSPTKIDVAEVEWVGKKYTVTSVMKDAFRNCGSLTSVSLPNATTIGLGAFQSCSSLTLVSLPNATTIGQSAFDGCEALTSLSLPNATTIGTEAFGGCSSLTLVSLPNATTIGEAVFDSCEALTSVSLLNATTIGADAFWNCTKLETVVLNWELLASQDREGWALRNEAKIVGPFTEDEIKNATYNVVFATGGTPIDRQNYEKGCAYYGLTPKPESQVVKEDEIAVTKESIQAAKAETISIANNEIHLGVSVLSNANITAEIAEWGKVKFDENTKVGLSEDGTQLIISIPVSAQQGFMILQSGDAKAVPADGEASGFYMIKVVQ